MFVHCHGILKNNPGKAKASLGDGEMVLFDVQLVPGRTSEAINVTGPDGQCVRGSIFSPNIPVILATDLPVHLDNELDAQQLNDDESIIRELADDTDPTSSSISVPVNESVVKLPSVFPPTVDIEDAPVIHPCTPLTHPTPVEYDMLPVKLTDYGSLDNDNDSEFRAYDVHVVTLETVPPDGDGIPDDMTMMRI